MLLDSLPHRCTIQRQVRTQGSLGGSKTTTQAVSTGVECWEQQASATEVDTYQKRGQTINRKVYFASDPSVTERHQIVVTSRDGGVTQLSSPTVLDVVSTPMPDVSAGLGVLYRVMCRDLSSDDD